jgi:hypothetical protein
MMMKFERAKSLCLSTCSIPARVGAVKTNKNKLTTSNLDRAKK